MHALCKLHARVWNREGPKLGGWQYNSCTIYNHVIRITIALGFTLKLFAASHVEILTRNCPLLENEWRQWGDDQRQQNNEFLILFWLAGRTREIAVTSDVPVLRASDVNVIWLIARASTTTSSWGLLETAGYFYWYFCWYVIVINKLWIRFPLHRFHTCIILLYFHSYASKSFVISKVRIL
jgi:hypothetical protein